jgi:acetylornithine deacetylase/succinyl-diaminopimelate desuccinylase-like protein
MTLRLLALLMTAALMPAGAQTLDWTKIDEEAMRHYQALVRIDTTDPPGNETRAVEYLRGVLEAEGIPVTIAAKDPARANLIARLKGNGSKRPVIFMGHTDEVQVDPSNPEISPTIGKGPLFMA